MGDFSQDFLSLLGPNERSGIFIVQPDVLLDRINQLRYATEHTATDALARNLPKPTLDKV